jgi:hypothetical protein
VVPGHHMVEVGVDQRAVDVEQNGGRCHRN